MSSLPKHFIAHRGNINGPNPKKENQPEYIEEALLAGYEAEIDVWVSNTGEIYLGHDNPDYLVDSSFLDKNRGKLWCHAKNFHALDYLQKNKYHCFYHVNDPYVFTNMGEILAHPDSQIYSNTISMMPECCPNEKFNIANLLTSKGICSDYISYIKTLARRPLQVVIPMAGLGSRFSTYGFRTNKYMLPVNINLDLMIHKAISSLNINIPCSYFFVIRTDQDESGQLSKYLKELCETKNWKYNIIYIDKITEGPASTVYECIDTLDMSAPLIVSNSDQVLEWSFDAFMQKCIQHDGCVLCYTPSYKPKLGSLDKNSYVRFSKDGKPVEFKEKIVLSDNALVGVHYFHSAYLFSQSYHYLVNHEIRAPNGEFYLSLCYDAMLKQNQNIGTHLLQTNERFFPVGEPNDYFEYLYKCGQYQSHVVKPASIKDMCFSSKYHIDFHIIGKSEKLEISTGVYLFWHGPFDHSLKVVTSNDTFVAENDCTILRFTHSEMNYDEIQGTYDLSRFVRGWFLGDFQPSIFRTKDIEIGVLTHKHDENWPFHYHAVATEYNILLDGHMILNNIPLHKGNHFVLRPCELACPKFLSDCTILCIKIPSVIGDKYVV